MDSDSALTVLKDAIRDQLDSMDLDGIRDALRTEIVEEIKDELRSAIDGTEQETAPQEGTPEAWGKEDRAGLVSFLAYMEENL